MDGTVLLFCITLYSMYDVFAWITRSWFIDATGIYGPGGHRIVSMIGPALTDLDGQCLRSQASGLRAVYSRTR